MSNRVSLRAMVLTTIRSQSSSFRRDGDRSLRQRYGVQLLGDPSVGRPMVLFDLDGNRRIVTSKVVRMFEADPEGGTFVETQNSLYLLECLGALQ